MRLASGIDTTMSMIDLLRDYELKRGRAMVQFKDLRDKADGFAEAHRNLTRGHFDPDGPKYEFKVPLEPFDPDWAVLLGEFLYNTRASLDDLVTALVRSTGKEVNDGNQFPIYAINKAIGWEKMNEWWDTAERVTRQLKNTPEGTSAALKQLQPFNGIPMTNPFQHPLWALARLNNRDKHRRLNLLARSAFVDFVDAAGEPLFPTRPFPHRIAERSEADTYTVTFNVLPDYPQVDMYLLTTQQVALHEPPELIGDLIETLRGINQFIDGHVLPTVKSLL